MTRHEEQLVIERAAAGDRDAAQQLVLAHQKSLYAYMLRMSGKAELAEDIVQDAFVRVLTNLDRFDPRFRFSTWLFTIAKRLYVNAIQKHRPVYDSEVVNAWQGRSDDPAAPSIADERRSRSRDAITNALQQLTVEQREVIILFHQQEWSISAIADYMDMPEGTVKSHLHRGRRRMKAIFEQQDEQNSAADPVEALI